MHEDRFVDYTKLHETMDKAFEDKIRKATSAEEIKVLMSERAITLGIIQQNEFGELIPVSAEQQPPTRFTKNITVNGVSKTVEGNSPEELQAAELEYMRSIFPTNDAARANREAAAQSRDDAGRFTEDPGALDEAEAARIVNLADLELKFKRGELNTADYLEQSGALEQALQKRESGFRYQQSWADATTEFLQAYPEWKVQWGTDANMQQMAKVLLKMGAAGDGVEPSAENMKSAYEWLKQNDKLVLSPDGETHRTIGEANSVEEIRNALGINERARNAMLFGK
jgi:hypothetical protein